MKIHDGSLAFRVASPLSDRDPSEATLENKHYVARATYVRDIEADAAAGTVDKRMLSVTTRRKDPRRNLPELTIPSYADPDQDRVLLPDNWHRLSLDDVRKYAENMEIASRSLVELRWAATELLRLSQSPDDADEAAEATKFAVRDADSGLYYTKKHGWSGKLSDAKLYASALSARMAAGRRGDRSLEVLP